MAKIARYFASLPYKMRQYGALAILNKVFVDASNYLNIGLPNTVKWRAAHKFHTSWKLQQRKYYGLDEYNKRIDEKSREVLIDFYEVGLSFKGKTVVDVGCGTRGILPIISARRRIGVDPTIEEVKNQFRFYEGAEYISEKIEDCTLPDNIADIITCNNTLNHVENPELALAQMRRILKPGGLLLLEVFIEPRNIAHTYEFTDYTLHRLVEGFFKPVMVKYEPLEVRVEIDEKLDGELPMRWGGIFQK